MRCFIGLCMPACALYAPNFTALSAVVSILAHFLFCDYCSRFRAAPELLYAYSGPLVYMIYVKTGWVMWPAETSAFVPSAFSADWAHSAMPAKVFAFRIYDGWWRLFKLFFFCAVPVLWRTCWVWRWVLFEPVFSGGRAPMIAGMR